MKKISMFACALLILILSEAQAQSTTQAQKAIEATNKKFMQWYNRGEIDSLVSIYRDDACLTNEGCGKTVVRQYYEYQMQLGLKFKALTTSELTVDKSVAIEKGRFTLTLQSGQEVSGDYVTEWKLTGKQWRIANDKATTSN